MNKLNRKYGLYAGVLLASFLFLKALVYFENQSADSNIHNVFDAFWYALVTLSTVGYGDYYPVTPMGRVLAVALIIGSLGVLSYIVGRISLKISNYMEKKKTGQFGSKLQNHFVIIGWDDFSKQVTNQIVGAGHKIAIIANNRQDIDLIRETYSTDQAFCLFADYDNYEAFSKANIENCSKIFINFDDDSKTLIHIINLRKHYQNLDFVVILNSQQLKDTFKSVGVTYIVSKNEIASKLVASYIFEPEAAFLTEDVMETSNTLEDSDILQFKVTPGNLYVNQDYNLAFNALKKDYNAILMGIAKANQEYKVLKNPSQACTVEENDYLILMANGVVKQQLAKDFKIHDGRID